MIGVTGSPADLETAAEFFELFKTPWEQAVPSRKYSAVVSVDGCTEHFDAELLLVYGSAPLAIDRLAGVDVHPAVGPTDIAWAESTFPVYGRLSVFDCEADRETPASGGRPAAYRYQSGRQVVRRIGYDLFEEVRFLLTQGQPSSKALAPTLELHIAFSGTSS